jgi:ElaB/YqjD/DUF883 family membrane-anchored ribosome-binding protein
MADSATNTTTNNNPAGHHQHTPVQNGMTSLKNALGGNQTVTKATEFAKQRPWATAALAGVVGMALLNTLRGRGMARAR